MRIFSLFEIFGALVGPFRPKLGPNWAQKWVFGWYLEFGSSDSSDIAYFNWFQRCLTVNWEFLVCSKFLGLLLFVSKFIYRIQIHFLNLNSLDFSRIAYYIRQQWYLSDSGGFSCLKMFGSDLKLSPNSFFVIFCLQIHFLEVNSFNYPSFLVFLLSFLLFFFPTIIL